jgi:hypothetical protein
MSEISEIPEMSEEELSEKADRMLEAARRGLTPHQLLIESSQADNANSEERAAAIAKNRERALKLLEALEKSGK